MSEIPTEEELHDRIKNQLNWRGPTDTVALLWLGYLSGLLEWGRIEIDVYSRLCDLLPRAGSKELSELFAGEPLTAEREKEIDDYLAAQKDQTED